MDYKKTLSTIAKSSIYIARSTLLSFIFGIIVNIIFLLLLIPELKILSDKFESNFSISGDFVSKLISYMPFTLVLLSFGIIFPVLYFVFGKRHGIKKSINKIITENKEFILVYLFNKFFEYLSKISVNQTDKSKTKIEVIKQLPVFLKNLDNLPRTQRTIYWFLINKLKFGDLISDIIENGGEELNLEMIVDISKQKISRYIEDNVPIPSFSWFWKLILVNLLIFFALKVFI